MAKDWIKMRVDLPSHPKVVRILSATGSDKFRVVGGLHAVWCIFDAHSTNGDLVGYTPETMDHIIGWSGFSDALIAVGWLSYDGSETLSMPDFDTHNGQSGKRRAEETERKRRSRDYPQSVRNESQKKSDKVRSRGEESRGDNTPCSPPKGEQIPYDDIFKLWGEILPELPQPQNKTDSRKRNIKARWHETAKVPAEDGSRDMPCNTLDFWERFFRRIRNQPFLMGEGPRGWRASIDSVTRKEQFYKIIEGSYLNEY